MERLTNPDSGVIKFNDANLMVAIIDKLKIYEDAEEQELLIKLPCKVRDLLYEPKTNCTEQITDIEVVFKAGGREFKHSDIGETVFLTREAALKGRNNHGR